MSADAETPDERTTQLADGRRIPLLGLGVWQVPDGPTCVNAVRWALELGYRHIDTAQAYGNEESVGRALRESGLSRDQVYITTKFAPSRKDPARELERSLKRLGVDFVDLYLVHWPRRGATRPWPGMERAHELGYARSIGVSNYDVTELEQVMAKAAVEPAVNQVRLSPFDFRQELLDEARRRRLVIEAYSPLGTGRHLSDGTVNRIAANAGRTPAQVLLRWCIQRDLVVLAKSTHRERIEENSRIFDFELSAGDMSELDALDRTGGTGRALERKWW
jgi:diketogulonate reductase-like aldo/keto reductase